MTDIVKSITNDYMQGQLGADAYKEMLSRHNLRDIEDAANLYQLARHHDMTFDEMLGNLVKGYHNSVIDEITSIRRSKHSGDTEERKNELTSCYVSMYQYVAQLERFKRTKQILAFDKDFISELIKTDSSFSLRYNIFATLPYDTFYIDLSVAKELCSEIGIDGMLIQIHSVRTVDAEFWILNCIPYKDGHSIIVTSQVLSNTNDGIELTVDEIVESMSIKTNDPDILAADYNRIFPMLINILLYLCSYEPDIRETVVSKRQRADAKKAKKDKKDYPAQVYLVGERFGAAFRKWTKGTLGSDQESTSDGSRKVKPHIRRAHWHRYWYGKRNSSDRELRLRWVHECECAFDDENTEVDAVKHKVKK